MARKSRSTKGKRGPGRPPKLGPEEVEVLVELVRETPTLSMDDLVWTFRQRRGISVSVPTAKKALEAAGFVRSRPSRARQDSGSAQGDGDASEEPKAAQYRYGPEHRDAGDRTRYPCGLTDSEWEQIRHLFDPPTRPGRPPKYPRRQMLDACIYVLRSGCSWRMLPKDFPPWDAVYRTFRRWQARGLFEAMYDELRALWRSRQHRNPAPTGSILDSQSVKTAPQGGPKGYDAAKKVKGRKRHLVTDTLGLLIAVVVTTANVQDRDAALPAVDRAKDKVPGLQKLWADSAYAGTKAHEIRRHHGLEVEIVRRSDDRNVGRWHEGQMPLFPQERGFIVLPKRWIIERTNAWNDRPRRMNKDHDRNLDVSTAWIWLAEGRRLLRRVIADTESLAA